VLPISVNKEVCDNVNMSCEGKLTDRMLRKRFGIAVLLAFVVFSLASATKDLAHDDEYPTVDYLELDIARQEVTE